MSRIVNFGLGAVGLGLLIAAPAQAAITQTSANVFAGASADIITGQDFSPAENDGQATLQSGQQIVNATAVVVNQDAQGDRGFDQEDVFANFSSPASGTVNLSGSSTSLSLGQNKMVQAFNSGSSFDYDFTISSNYTFDVTYFLAETDSFYFDNYYQLIKTSGGPPIISGSPVDGSYAAPDIGGDSAFLTPGSYEFGVTSSLGDLSEAQGFGYSAGAHTDQYNFNLVSAAPEPSTWSLMIVGLGGVGLMFRRAKKTMSAGLKYAFTA